MLHVHAYSLDLIARKRSKDGKEIVVAHFLNNSFGFCHSVY